MTAEYLVRPDLIAADDARNLSRGGLPPDPAGVEEMAALLLRHGQLAPVEVDASAWPDDWWDRTPDDRWGLTPDECFERWVGHEPPSLVYGYRRRAAALLLCQRGLTSERWQGLLRVVVAPAGLTREEIEDRNLAENLGREDVSVVDKGLAAHRLTARPEDGGRGEDEAVAARKLRVTVPELRQLRLLPALCAEARAAARLHHRDKERGITPHQALKLARRPLEVQQQILAEARDAGGVVTPKAARAVIAPLSGRQGQPPGVTGAQLERVRARLDRAAGSEDELRRLGLTREQAALARDLCAFLVRLDPALRRGLPGHLARVVEAEVSRVPGSEA